MKSAKMFRFVLNLLDIWIFIKRYKHLVQKYSTHRPMNIEYLALAQFPQYNIYATLDKSFSESHSHKNKFLDPCLPPGWFNFNQRTKVVMHFDDGFLGLRLMMRKLCIRLCNFCSRILGTQYKKLSQCDF